MYSTIRINWKEVWNHIMYINLKFPRSAVFVQFLKLRWFLCKLVTEGKKIWKFIKGFHYLDCIRLIQFARTRLFIQVKEYFIAVLVHLILWFHGITESNIVGIYVHRAQTKVAMENLASRLIQLTPHMYVMNQFLMAYSSCPRRYFRKSLYTDLKPFI